MASFTYTGPSDDEGNRTVKHTQVYAPCPSAAHHPSTRRDRTPSDAAHAPPAASADLLHLAEPRATPRDLREPSAA